MDIEAIPAIFEKYDVDNLAIRDQGLARYMNLETTQMHQHARHANRRFKKANLSIVERLTNNMMRTERYTGKKTKARVRPKKKVRVKKTLARMAKKKGVERKKAKKTARPRKVTSRKTANKKVTRRARR